MIIRSLNADETDIPRDSREEADNWLNWSSLTREEKNHLLFLKQKVLLRISIFVRSQKCPIIDFWIFEIIFPLNTEPLCFQRFFGRAEYDFKTTSDEWSVDRIWVNELRIIRPESVFGQPIEDFLVDIAVEVKIRLEETRRISAAFRNSYKLNLQLHLRYSFDLISSSCFKRHTAMITAPICASGSGRIRLRTARRPWSGWKYRQIHFPGI